MITTWQYVIVPNGIDLTADLLPLRNANDMKRYGVDVAWLREVLQVWRQIQNQSSSPPPAQPWIAMSIHPSADFTNATRSLATNLKSYQLNPGTVIFDSAIPSSAFAADSAIDSLKVTFGTVPANVASGDPVQEAHVSDMFAWMQDVVGCHKAGSAAISSWSTSSGADGDSTVPSNPSASAETLLLWFWEYSGDTFNHQWDGGYYKKQTATSITVIATMKSCMAYWFESASFFIKVASYETRRGSATHTAFIPLGTATITQSGTDVAVSGTCGGDTAVASAKSALGVAETPYSTVGDGESYLRIDVERVVCFLKLAADYRYPTQSL